MQQKSRERFWKAAFILWIAIIFGQSSMPATVSNVESGGLLTIISKYLPFITHHLLRKLAHFTEFAILGFLLAQCFHRSIFWPLFVGVLCAMTDETIQLFVSGRSGQLTDVWLDFAGVITGSVLTNAIQRLRERRKG